MAIEAPEKLEKQEAERRYYSMDFSSLMATGETITSITSITSEDRDGENTSDLVIGAEVINGQTVEMWISGGTKFHVYRVEITIVTSTTAILQGDGLIEILD